MAPLNILIVGCSVAGPTLASFLLLAPVPATEKPCITLLERSPTLRGAGQNIDIRGTGVTIMRKLGIEKIVRASTVGEEGVHFVDEANQIWASFAADKSGKRQTGTSDIEILRGRMAEICWKRSKTISDDVQQEGGVGIEYIFGDTLDTIDQDGSTVHVRFARSGERRSFDLVIGADGLQSKTRNSVWGADGEKDRIKRLGMFIGFFSMPSGPTDSEWRRWFHASGRRGIMLRPGGQPNRTTVLMSVINEQDPRLLEVAEAGHKGVEAQKQLLNQYFQDAGWESERVIKAMMDTDDFYYDMVAQVKMDKWTKGRVALLGDAGYCGSPISGMGTTLALNGAYNLAGAITRFPDDHVAAFAEYERKMRPLVERAQKLPPGAPHIINPETDWGIWVMHSIMFTLAWSRIVNLLTILFGPPANAIQVDEYDLQQPSELLE